MIGRLHHPQSTESWRCQICSTVAVGRHYGCVAELEQFDDLVENGVEQHQAT
jgi:hypothetical protein